MKITDTHLQHWVEHGYTVVENFLTADEVAAALADIEDLLRERPKAPDGKDLPVGSIGFPFTYDSLNRFVVHADLLDFAERAIGTQDIYLCESILWPKHADGGDYEQDLHVDWALDSAVPTREDGLYRQVTAAVYYTDVTEDLAPTRVVSKQHTRHIPQCPPAITRDGSNDHWKRPAQRMPELFEREQAIVVAAGSLLIWGPRTWHRGSGFRATTGRRFAQFNRYASSLTATHPGFQGGMTGLRRFVETSSPRARQLIGIPGIGDPYWTEETLELVEARYPGMDITPYRKAFEAADRSLAPAG